GFLILDRNKNGVIDDGTELFGNFTQQSPSDHPNGFIALAMFDQPENGGNGNGEIDAQDQIFQSLRLWIDKNHDGISQPDELVTLTDAGVQSISLNYEESPMQDRFGNLFRYRARVVFSNPHSYPWAYDVFLKQAGPNSCGVAAMKLPVAGAICKLRNSNLDMLWNTFNIPGRKVLFDKSY